MPYANKAIPTRYNGVQFRSRLEARWAAFFDLCGWRWDYEPMDLDGWIPDFLIEKKLLVEIKPIIFIEEPSKFKLTSDVVKIAACPAEHEVLLLGSSPVKLETCGAYEADDGTISCIGMLAEISAITEEDHLEFLNKEYIFGNKYILPDDGLFKLADNNLIDVGGSYMSWHGRLHRPASSNKIQCVPWAVIERLWREAGNVVQWKKSGR